MDGVKSERRDLVKNIAMDGPKVGKFEHYENYDETMSQSEERLCKSIIRGLVKRNHEKHGVICFGDIIGKELPWHAVREAPELELKYLRDLGVYEKVDEKEAVEKYGSLQWTRNGSTQTRRSRESQCKSDRECVRENSTVMIGQTCMQGLLHWRR